jgi:hypothetical protein
MSACTNLSRPARTAPSSRRGDEPDRLATCCVSVTRPASRRRSSRVPMMSESLAAGLSQGRSAAVGEITPATAGDTASRDPESGAVAGTPAAPPTRETTVGAKRRDRRHVPTACQTPGSACYACDLPGHLIGRGGCLPVEMRAWCACVRPVSDPVSGVVGRGGGASRDARGGWAVSSEDGVGCCLRPEGVLWRGWQATGRGSSSRCARVHHRWPRWPHPGEPRAAA